MQVDTRYQFKVLETVSFQAESVESECPLPKIAGSILPQLNWELNEVYGEIITPHGPWKELKISKHPGVSAEQEIGLFFVYADVIQLWTSSAKSKDLQIAVPTILPEKLYEKFRAHQDGMHNPPTRNQYGQWYSWWPHYKHSFQRDDILTPKAKDYQLYEPCKVHTYAFYQVDDKRRYYGPRRLWTSGCLLFKFPGGGQ